MQNRGYGPYLRRGPLATSIPKKDQIREKNKPRGNGFDAGGPQPEV